MRSGFITWALYSTRLSSHIVYIWQSRAKIAKFSSAANLIWPPLMWWSQGTLHCVYVYRWWWLMAHLHVYMYRCSYDIVRSGSLCSETCRVTKGAYCILRDSLNNYYYRLVSHGEVHQFDHSWFWFTYPSPLLHPFRPPSQLRIFSAHNGAPAAINTHVHDCICELRASP